MEINTWQIISLIGFGFMIGLFFGAAWIDSYNQKFTFECDFDSLSSKLNNTLQEKELTLSEKETCKMFTWITYANMDHQNYTVYDYETIKANDKWVECCGYFTNHTDLTDYNNASWNQLIRRCGTMKK